MKKHQDEITRLYAEIARLEEKKTAGYENARDLRKPVYEKDVMDRLRIYFTFNNPHQKKKGRESYLWLR